MAAERPHCLVIGVGAGTGLACVRRFVDEGYKVSMIARNEDRLTGWAEDIANTVAYPSGLTELDPADFERNFRANTTGLLVTAQVFAPDMVEAGNGAIVITGNTSARRGIPRFVGFAPTKASQLILGESLARELGPQNVHIAYVMIDARIDMPMVRKLMPGVPAEQLAQPDDIAGEVFHIAHQPRSTWSYLHQIRPFGETW